MLEFVARAFRSWVAFILWLIIIGCAIIGGAIGGIAGGGLGIFTFLVGGFVGLIIAILFGGFVANFLNMVDNTAEIKALLKQQLGLSFNNAIPSNNPAAYDWVCKKCDNTNNKTALFCNSCGEKK